MKQITVSTDVFARIWSLRTDGEDSEDVILKRILWSQGAPPLQGGPTTGSSIGGILDRRFSAHFPEGFAIDRTYRGRYFRAEVRNGQWKLDGHEGVFTGLNELSRAIGTKVENAWVNWFYVDESGQRRPVSDIRDPNTIASRRNESESSAGRTHSDPNNQEGAMANQNVRWVDDVKEALINLGGRASLERIYREVENIRRKHGRSVPESLEATIRRTLEDFSSDSDNYRGEDWFCMSEGKGSGIWALRSKV